MSLQDFLNNLPTKKKSILEKTPEEKIQEINDKIAFITENPEQFISEEKIRIEKLKNSVPIICSIGVGQKSFYQFYCETLETIDSLKDSYIEKKLNELNSQKFILEYNLENNS